MSRIDNMVTAALAAGLWALVYWVYTETGWDPTYAAGVSAVYTVVYWSRVR